MPQTFRRRVVAVALSVVLLLGGAMARGTAAGQPEPSEPQPLSLDDLAALDALLAEDAEEAVAVIDEGALLDVAPETGRTHQIRVHLASTGLPIVGDKVYGRGGGLKREQSLGRPALHAASLGFEHPRTGETIRFEAELPPELLELLAYYEERENAP